MKTEPVKIILKNRRAYFNYQISETYEAGLVLKGTEVKSIRDGNASINEGYVRFYQGELFVYNMDISLYKFGNIFNHEPKRPRKLLLRKSEIKRLIGRLTQRGLTVIPLSLYFKNGFAKLEIGLAQGKKLYDKRDALKKKMAEREIARASQRR